MSTIQVKNILVFLNVLVAALLLLGTNAVSATTQNDPISDYINQINTNNLSSVATDLVTLYGPRRSDIYSPYLNANCTFSNTVYPKSTIEMSSDYVKGLFEEQGYPASSITMEVVAGGVGRNVYVTKVGSKYPNVYIEYGAHLDSADGTPGGNDNASGVAGVIELARILKDYPSRYSMRFVLWVAEEDDGIWGPHYGSHYHVEQVLARGEQIKAGLVMDHIGWPDPSDTTGLMNEVSYDGAESERIADLFDSVRTEYQIEIGFGKDETIQNSDEHSYWDLNQTAVSSGGGWLNYRPNYHGCGDTVSNIDFTNVLRVAQQNLAVGLKLDEEPYTPTAVSVAPLQAKSLHESILVGWQSVSELDIISYTLYRSVEKKGEPRMIYQVPAANPGQLWGVSYGFIDRTIEKNVVYFYWLEVEKNGTNEMLDPAFAMLAAHKLYLPTVQRK